MILGVKPQRVERAIEGAWGKVTLFIDRPTVEIQANVVDMRFQQPSRCGQAALVLRGCVKDWRGVQEAKEKGGTPEEVSFSRAAFDRACAEYPAFADKVDEALLELHFGIDPDSKEREGN
jgi:hypothetical protein